MLLREVYDKPEYEIVYLKEFTPDQVKEYLKKALKDKWKDAHDKIKNIYNLEDLSHRPVLLDMIVKTLPKIDLKGKDEFNVVHLYEVYTFSWIERDDHRFQIIKEGKEELVEGLACKLWQEGEKSIHYTALTDVLSRHLKSKIKTTRETVKLWEVESGRLLHTLEGHSDYVNTVFISPDNRFIVSGSLDNTIKTWDIDTGQLIYSITLIPGNQYIIFKGKKFIAPETALQYLYYTDGLARYPAKDLPELRLRS